MRVPLLAAACAAMVAFASISSPATAGELRTARQCRDEWRADKAANLAKGIKKKDYVAQCRGTPAMPVADATGVQPEAPGVAAPKSKIFRWRWRARVLVPGAREATGAAWY